MAMPPETTSAGQSDPRDRRPPSTRYGERALMSAMRGALRRSIVLLPLDEEDDLPERFLEAAVAATR
jgi:hypothetical protein